MQDSLGYLQNSLKRPKKNPQTNKNIFLLQELDPAVIFYIRMPSLYQYPANLLYTEAEQHETAFIQEEC